MGTSGRRQRERRERKNTILDAAEAVFFSKGFQMATMEEVAAEAELSKGAIYLYFKNKYDLLVSVGSRVLERVLEGFEASAPAESGLEELRLLVECYSSVLLRKPDHFRMAVTWMISSEMVDTTTDAFVQHRELVSKLMGAVVSAIRRGKADGSVRTDLGDHELAAHVQATVVGSLMIRVNADELLRRVPQPVSVDCLLPNAVTLLCDGLRRDRESESS